jgi:TolB protein
MKHNIINTIKICLPIILVVVACNLSLGQNQPELNIPVEVPVIGQTKPIPVSIEGFGNEVTDILKFDLYVQGFTFVTPDAAQYHINGTGDDNVVGRVMVGRNTILSRSYNGATLRRQAHAFADDVVQAITGKKGIAQTRIAFKVQSANGDGKIYIADFDGHNAQSITPDATIVAAPAWSPSQTVLYYTSYKLGNPDIFYHNLSTGERRVVAGYSGLNTSAAAAPDGTRVAMILSRSGSPEVWLCNPDGGGLKQLTSTPEGASSPCWSPDGQWICFATEIHGRRMLAKVPAEGGDIQRIPTVGVSNPSEPSWSPDGKWIAFTSQMSEFDICVVPAEGGNAFILVRGEEPSWSPNSRTLIYSRTTPSYRDVLSLLDVYTKQVKDIRQISGNDSEPAWAK